MKLAEYLLEIEKFLKEYLVSSHQDGYVLGLSGGVDSSLVASIARKAVGKNKLHCYAIDVESNHKDIEDALKVAKELDVNIEVINLTDTYHSFYKTLERQNEFTRLTKSNLKVRMRMATLFAFAQEKHALVLGTDNADERYVGYFTKYGDGAADVLPISRLTKSEVREAAKMYGLSDELADRIATAGLFEGQTDEGEMGVTYKDLDNYLLGKEVPTKSKERIEYLHKISEHKRNPIPEPIPFERD